MLHEGYVEGWGVPPARLAALPPEYREEMSDGLATLSTWACLLWERGRDELLGEELLDLPRLEMNASFRQDWQDRRANRRERLELQERLARVAVLLDQSNGDTSPLKRDGSLQYDNYAGANSGIGHFRVNNHGWRVTCTSGGGRLKLRRFGPHEINDNP